MMEAGQHPEKGSPKYTFLQLLQTIINYRPGDRIDGRAGNRDHFPDDFPQWSRVGVFGQFSAGKSSFLNNIQWVLGYPNSRFVQKFASCHRTAAMGGHTHRMQPSDVIPTMTFIDTRGFAEVNSKVCSEIWRICEGYRSFRDTITWTRGFWQAIRDFFYWLFFSSWREANKLDFAILIIKGQKGGPNISIQETVVPVAAAIKSAIGCPPLVVITGKDEMTEEDRVVFQTSLRGFGIPRVIFVENYLIEDDGTVPRQEDINMENHLEFLEVLDNLQEEYDNWLLAQFHLHSRAYERTIRNRRGNRNKSQ